MEIGALLVAGLVGAVTVLMMMVLRLRHQLAEETDKKCALRIQIYTYGYLLFHAIITSNVKGWLKELS